MRLIDADGSYTLNASDNTDYSLCFGGGIISVIDKHGHIDCEFFADDAPTVNIGPVRHGHWISNDPYIGWHCSSCERNNDYAFICDYEDSKYVLQDCYCPYCGAKMDEVIL